MARGALVQGVELPASTGEVYQLSGGSARAQIQKAQFVNTSVAVATISIWVTPNDTVTTPTDQHLVIDNLDIAVDKTYLSTELIGEYINAGGRVFAQSSQTGVYLWLNGNTLGT